MRVYAVGDVHGRADLLAQLFYEIDADLKAHPASRAIHVFLGYYIGRGPDSRQVLDLLLARNQRHAMIFLRGNHEILVEEFLRNPASFAIWRDTGGIETLLSYGIRLRIPIQMPSSRGCSPSDLQRSCRRRIGNLCKALNGHSIAETFLCSCRRTARRSVVTTADEDLFWIRDKFLNSKEIRKDYRART